MVDVHARLLGMPLDEYRRKQRQRGGPSPSGRREGEKTVAMIQQYSTANFNPLRIVDNPWQSTTLPSDSSGGSKCNAETPTTRCHTVPEPPRPCVSIRADLPHDPSLESQLTGMKIRVAHGAGQSKTDRADLQPLPPATPKAPQSHPKSTHRGKLVRGQVKSVGASVRSTERPPVDCGQHFSSLLAPVQRPSTVGGPAGRVRGDNERLAARSDAQTSRPSTVGSAGLRRHFRGVAPSGRSPGNVLTPRAGESCTDGRYLRRSLGGRSRPVTASHLVDRDVNAVAYKAARLTFLSSRPSTTGSLPMTRQAGASLSSVFAARSWEGRNVRSEREQLEDLVAAVESAKRRVADPHDANQLQAYVQCFDRLIELFRTCRPLLSQIKAEYDRHLRIKGRELEEARFLLRKKPALEEQTASIADAIRDQSAMSNHALHSALQEEIEKKKGLDTALQQQNAKLAKVQAELAAVNEEKKNMQVIYSDLNSVMNMHGRTMDARYKQWEVDGAVMINYREEIQDQRGEVRYAKSKFEDKAFELKHSSEDLKEAKTESRKLRDRYKHLHAQRQRMLEETEETKNKYETMKSTCTSFMRDSITCGNCTPRPDWDECKELLSVGMELDTSKPSLAIGAQLQNNIKTMQDEYRKALEDQAKLIAEGHDLDAAPSSQAQTVEEEEEEEEAPKWFVCKGTSPAIPEFLRATGKVRNKRLRKAATEQLLNDFWKAKLEHDKNRRGSDKVSVQDYLFQFLLATNDGNQRAAVEMGYNLMDSLKRYSYDADCEIFHQILVRELPEAAYHSQLQLMDDFITKCRKVVRAGSNAENPEVETASAPSAGVPILDRTIFLQVLDSFFPFKSAYDLRALKRALASDQPVGPVFFAKLFEETSDGDQGKFAETFRDQNMYEVGKAYPDLENAIRSQIADQQQAKGGTSAISSDNRDYYSDFLRQVPLLKDMTFPEMEDMLTNGCSVVEYQDGEEVICQGAHGHCMYIVIKGQAYVVKDGIEHVDKPCSSGDFFGELALVENEVRAATVVAKTVVGSGPGPQNLVCMRITARYFQLVKRNKAAVL